METCGPELLLPRLIVISSGAAEGLADREPLPWPRLMTSSGVAVVPLVAPLVDPPVDPVDPLEAPVPDASPKLMTISETPDDEELLSWPRLMTTSGVVVAAPLEAPVLDAPPRLMTISAALEL